MPCNHYRSNKIFNSSPIRTSPLWCHVCDRVFPSRQTFLDHKNGTAELGRIPKRADQLQRNPSRRPAVRLVVSKSENDAPSNPSGRGFPSVTATASGAEGSETLTIVTEEQVVAGARKLLEAFRENNSLSVGEDSEGTATNPNVQAPRENNDGNETDSEDEREELYLEIRL